MRKHYLYQKKTSNYGVIPCIPSVYFYTADCKKHYIVQQKDFGTKVTKHKFVQLYVKHLDKKITVDTHSRRNKTLVAHMKKFISEFCKKLGMKFNMLKGHVLSLGSIFENLRIKSFGVAAQIDLDFMLQLDDP